MSDRLEPGDKAPAFTLTNDARRQGEVVRLQGQDRGSVRLPRGHDPGVHDPGV